MPNVNSLASAVAEILRGSPNFESFPTPGPAHFPLCVGPWVWELRNVKDILSKES